MALVPPGKGTEQVEEEAGAKPAGSEAAQERLDAVANK